MDTTSAGASSHNWGVNFTRWAVIILLLHPLSLGPLLYFEARGGFTIPASDAAIGLFYAPEIYVLMYDVPYLAIPSEGYRRYITWCQERGKAHATAPSAATSGAKSGP